MRITKILLFATALVVLLISCEKEDMYEMESVTTRVMDEENGIGYASVYLEDPTVISTRSSENKIYDLSFFVFNSDGTRDTQYGYQPFPYTGNQYTFPVTAGNNKTIIAVANLQHLGDLNNANLETVQQILRRTLSQRPADIPKSGVAMFAENSGIQTRGGDVKIIKMSLSDTFLQ